MIKIENVEICGLNPALRGMRNPKNSWDKSDTHNCNLVKYGPDACVDCDKALNDCGKFGVSIMMGENDHKLAMSLAQGGPVHAKYRRMIAVYLDITAPLYWWKEFDTYKVGTVANSCSTMHKIHSKEFTLDDFSHEHLFDEDTKFGSIGSLGILKATVCALNLARNAFLKYDDKRYWWQMIQMLPSSYNQRRTIMLNYEVLTDIYRWRRDHKLDEWQHFCDWVESLPYSELITGKSD